MPRFQRFLCALLTLGFAVVAAAAPEFPRDDDALIIAFDRYSLKLAHRDPTPLLRVYGSGRVTLYHWQFSPLAGRYELYLSEPELIDLVQALDDRGVQDFGSMALAEAVERAEIERRDITGSLYYTSDATITELTVALDPVRQPTTVQFENLQPSAQRHEHLRDVQRFAEIERLLLELARRPDFTRVGDARTLVEDR